MITINDSPVPHLQTPWEFDALIKFIYKPASPRVVMEIGSFYGATLWSFIVNNPSLEKIISVDLPIGSEDSRFRDMQKSREKWNSWSDKIIDIQGDSHSFDTLRRVQEEVEQIDFLFIDGDHSYTGVRRDYEIYSPLVKEGGIIVFHDSIGYNSVKKFTDELEQFLASKFIKINQKNGWGLFVLEK